MNNTIKWMLIFIFLKASSIIAFENTYLDQLHFLPSEKPIVQDCLNKHIYQYNLSPLTRGNEQEWVIDHLKNHTVDIIVEYFIRLGNLDILSQTEMNDDYITKHVKIYALFFAESDQLFKNKVTSFIMHAITHAKNHEYEKLSHLLIGLRALTFIHCARLVSSNKGFHLPDDFSFMDMAQIPNFNQLRNYSLATGFANCEEIATLLEKQYKLFNIRNDMFFEQFDDISHKFNITDNKNIITVIDAYYYEIFSFRKNDYNFTNKSININYQGIWKNKKLGYKTIGNKNNVYQFLKHDLSHRLPSSDIFNKSNYYYNLFFYYCIKLLLIEEYEQELHPTGTIIDIETKKLVCLLLSKIFSKDVFNIACNDPSTTPFIMLLKLIKFMQDNGASITLKSNHINVKNYRFNKFYKDLNNTKDKQKRKLFMQTYLRYKEVINFIVPASLL